MTEIGFAVLKIIPSLRGVSDSVNKQLAAMPDLGKDAGKSLGKNLSGWKRCWGWREERRQQG